MPTKTRGSLTDQTMNSSVSPNPPSMGRIPVKRTRITVVQESGVVPIAMPSTAETASSTAEQAKNEAGMARDRIVAPDPFLSTRIRSAM